MDGRTDGWIRRSLLLCRTVGLMSTSFTALCSCLFGSGFCCFPLYVLRTCTVPRFIRLIAVLDLHACVSAFVFVFYAAFFSSSACEAASWNLLGDSEASKYTVLSVCRWSTELDQFGLYFCIHCVAFIVPACCYHSSSKYV